jgi:hypothetical protein
MPAPGPDKELCGARKTAAKPKGCGARAGAGTAHLGFGNCSKHGGNTSSHRKAGELAKAEAVAAQLGIPIETNPYDALRNSLAVENGIVEFFREAVVRIDPDCHFVRPTSVLRRPLDEGKEGENPGIEVEEITEGPEDLHIALKALERWLLMRDKTSKTIIDANLDKKILALHEDRARYVVEGMLRVFELIGVPIDQKVLDAVRKVFPDDDTIEGTAHETR